MKDQLRMASGRKVHGPFLCGAPPNEVSESMLTSIGCYIIVDERENVVYVGKAIRFPHETANPNARGLYGRVRGHDDSQGKGGPVSFLRDEELLLTTPPSTSVAPFVVNEHRQRAIAAARETFRHMTWYGVPTETAQEAGKLEDRLREELSPYVNPKRARR